MPERCGIIVRADTGPGILHQLSGVIAGHRGDIASVEIISLGAGEARVYFEIDLPNAADPLLSDLRGMPIVREASMVQTLQAIYGKRIIIVGGGAQVGQVALGAIAEADRHN